VGGAGQALGVRGEGFHLLSHPKPGVAAPIVAVKIVGNRFTWFSADYMTAHPARVLRSFAGRALARGGVERYGGRVIESVTPGARYSFDRKVPGKGSQWVSALACRPPA